ncbi:MAG: hypothetical protein HYY18_19180 [Planctomycetes bacterium]|nr:hypothetical protein [Planctomycetota bacterium]
MCVVAALANSGCFRGTKQVEIESIQVVGTDADGLRIEVVTSEDLASLEGSKWAEVVLLGFSFPEATVSFRDREGYDPEDFTNRRPFGATPISRDSSPRGAGFASCWRIPPTENSGDRHVAYSYDLRDGKSHVLTFELYGAAILGGYVRSNSFPLEVGPLK